MHYEKLHHAILQILLKSKREDRHGVLNTDSIMQRLGGEVGDDDVQYCLNLLGANELVQLAVGDDRIQAAVLTIRGEAVARSDIATYSINKPEPTTTSEPLPLTPIPIDTTRLPVEQSATQ